MHVMKMDVQGEPNLGLLANCNEEICLVGRNFTEKETEKIEKVLDVDIKKVSIAGTNLIGIFTAMNSTGLILPSIIEDYEREELEKLGLNILVPETIENAFGNLILVNDYGCVIPKVLERIKNDIKECFGVPVEVGTIAGSRLLGSMGVVTNRGLLAHRDCTEEELKHLEKVLGVEGDIGTVNFGSPFVGAFVLANSRGVLVPEMTTGPEIARVDEALGFLR